MTPAQKLEFARMYPSLDLGNTLSYAPGIKNYVGIKKNNRSIRVRIENPTANDAVIYLASFRGQIADKIKLGSKNSSLPTGRYLFELPNSQPGGGDADVVIVKNQNRDQSIADIAQDAMYSPFQVIGLSLRSFKKSTGIGENTNFGNSITTYHLPAFGKVNYKDLNLGEFQSARDNSTEILKVDLLKQGFDAKVSQDDVIGFQVNADTALEITFHIGARFSIPELFDRMIKAANSDLVSAFPAEFANCECK